jgi:ribokinase
MTKILVSGLINIETTVKVEGFPIEYAPVHYPFFGVNSTVSGVGYNVAKALRTLGDEVCFLSIIGTDLAASMVVKTLQMIDISDEFIVQGMTHTAQSAIFYDPSGRRQINVDLKDIQEQNYPLDLFDQALQDCSLATLCNINFSRPFLSRTRQAGKLIATDVHAISDLSDPYNADFMRAADILFMSDEWLPCAPEDWAQQVQNRYGNPIIVVGLGAEGALLAVKDDHFMERIPAVQTRKVVNTIGAGDALFSCFTHFYAQTSDPYQAIRKAIVFASWKIGETGAAEGFLDQKALKALLRTCNS